MSQLNIKNLWVQQTKNNEETLEPTEIKVTDIKVELNEEETRICEGIIHKIRERSKEVRKINNKSAEKVLENTVRKTFERIYEEMVTYSKKNLENNQEETNNESSEETQENSNKDEQMEENDEGNSSEELSELEDEPPKENRKRRREDESQETRKRNRTERKSRMIEELIQELGTPVDEEDEIIEEIEEENPEQNDIRKLVGMFHEIEKINRKQIWKLYNYGRKFEQKVEEIKNQRRKKIPSKTARSKLYDQMKGEMTNNITRMAIRKRTQRAIKIYEFFTEIGRERINRIKDCPVEAIIKLTEEEIKQIKNHFRRK